MALGRALRPRTFGAGLYPQRMRAAYARRHWTWPELVLLLIALIASAFAVWSLFVDPPSGPSPDTSYLPQDPPPEP